MPIVLALLLVGCTEPLADSEGVVYVDPPELDVSTTLGDVPTVVTVRWAGAGDATVKVEYGPNADYGHDALPPQDDPDSALLVGNLPSAELHFRLVGEDASGTWRTEDMTVATGTRPDDVPVFESLAPVDGGWGSFVLAPVFDLATGTSTIVLVDRDGEVVWWYPVDASVQAVRLAANGDVVFLAEGARDGSPNGLWSVPWVGGTSERRVTAAAAHHDFLERPDGTLVLVESDVQSWEGEDVVGDRLVEYAVDGSSRVVWNSWATLTPTFDQAGGVSTPAGLDWTHVNGVDWDAATNTYLLSAYWLHALFAIDGGSGEITWQLGGDGSDFVFQDDPGFGPQHAPVFVDGGVLVYDNHSMGGPQDPITASRAVRYALDTSVAQATPVWEFVPDPSVMEGVLGDVRWLADGTFYVNSGKAGRAAAVTEEGELLYAVQGPSNAALGRGVVLGADMKPQ